MLIETENTQLAMIEMGIQPQWMFSLPGLDELMTGWIVEVEANLNGSALLLATDEQWLNLFASAINNFVSDGPAWDFTLHAAQFKAYLLQRGESGLKR